MVGHTLSDWLRDQPGLFVSGTDRQGSGRLLGFSVENGRRDLNRLLLEVRPQCVINAIGVLDAMIDPRDAASVERAIEINALFPHWLAAAAEAANSRVLHISTDAVFARSAGRVTEGTVPAPDDVYGQTKLLGECPRENVLNLRCSMIGPDPVKRRGLWEWLRSRPARAEVSGYTNQAWNGVTTLQLARVCAQLAEPETFARLRQSSPCVHLCSAPPISKFDLLTYLAKRVRPDVRVVPAQSPRSVTRVLESQFGLAEAIGETATEWDAAIAELVRFEDSHPRTSFG
jgi:dTDP-4-dehydrorhamnose reductase